MKQFFVILMACLNAPVAFAGPVADAKAELKLLADLCPKLPAAGGSCPDLKQAAQKAEKLCLASHQMFSRALAEARGKVKETTQWMATKQMVNETEDYIHISFSLSSDPDYPMIDAHDRIVNESLHESLKNIYAVQEDLNEIRQKRSCTEKEVKRFTDVWTNAENKHGIDRAHEKISMAVSNYLIGAMRAFESGAHEDAIKALERETGAKVKKVK